MLVLDEQRPAQAVSVFLFSAAGTPVSVAAGDGAPCCAATSVPSAAMPYLGVT
jgi:hypothetical protein